MQGHMFIIGHLSSFHPCVSKVFSKKYLFDHYLHFLKLHIINNYINSLFIWSRRLPLRPHVVAGMGATFMETKIHVFRQLVINALFCNVVYLPLSAQ